jgi:putative polyhydroxyalkanoate system protein
MPPDAPPASSPRPVRAQDRDPPGDIRRGCRYPSPTVRDRQEIVAMSMIDIRHSHSLSLAKARKAVEEVAQKLSDRFEFEYEWDGDDLHFSRSGVDGRIALSPKELHVTAKLGFLVSAFKGPIEHEIRRVLDERFN